MDKNNFLAALERESQEFLETVKGDLNAAAPMCGDWTTRELAVHLGTVWRFATANVSAATEAPAKRERAFEKGVVPSDAEVCTFLDQGIDNLLAALRTAEPDDLAWTFSPDFQTAGFWQRRMAHETAVHRWDAQISVSGSATEIEAELASDGIDEYIQVALMPSVFRPERTYPKSSIHLHCTDVAGEWTMVGNGESTVTVTREHVKADAAIKGTASELLLWIWGRADRDVQIFGDETVASTWQALAP